MVLSFIDHHWVKLQVDVVNLGLRGCHEPTLRVDIAKRSFAILAALFLLFDYFISRPCFDLVLDVDIIDQIQEHGEVFKCHTFDSPDLLSFFIGTGLV